MVVAVLNLLAAAWYAFVAVHAGFPGHVGATLFSSYDSTTYRDVADWLFHSRPNPVASQWRPFLYPLLLGSADRLGDASGIWFLNLLFWFGTLNLTAFGVWRLTGRWLAGLVVFLVLAANASLIVLSFQALTEVMTTFLEAIWIFAFATIDVPPIRARHVALLLLPLSLLTVVKPVYEAALILALLLVGVTILRRPGMRGAALLAAALSCVPVLMQLILMISANHYFGLSTIGEAVFKDEYFSRVYASVHGLPSDLIAARIADRDYSDGQIIVFLIAHPLASLTTFTSVLADNANSGSNFVNRFARPNLARTIIATNHAYRLAHALFLPIVALAFWRTTERWRLFVLSLFAVVVVFSAGLISGQGDRYLVPALPLWTAVYAIAVCELLTAKRLSEARAAIIQARGRLLSNAESGARPPS